MLAFTNTTHTKESAVALAKLHRDQDAYIRGTYGKQTPEGWRGCSVGCMAKGKHENYPELFGIDIRIAYLSDKFFEKIKDYKNWTVKLFDSVKEGSDTTIAYYKFMHWMLIDPEFGVSRFNDDESIKNVAALFLKAAQGDKVTVTEWHNAADADAAANAAADAAAYAAAYAAAANAAANAAAYAAAANAGHYEAMADKLCYFLAGGE